MLHEHLHGVLAISTVLYYFAPFVEVEYFDDQDAFTSILTFFLVRAQNQHYFYFLYKICCHRRRS